MSILHLHGKWRGEKISSWKFNRRFLHKTNKDEQDLVKFSGIICCVACKLLCQRERKRTGKLNGWDKNRTIQFKCVCNEKMKIKYRNYFRIKGNYWNFVHFRSLYRFNKILYTFTFKNKTWSTVNSNPNEQSNAMH